MSRDTKNNTINRSSSRNKHTTDSENLRGATALEGDTTLKLSATRVKVLRELVRSKRERKGEKT